MCFHFSYNLNLTKFKIFVLLLFHIQLELTTYLPFLAFFMLSCVYVLLSGVIFLLLKTLFSLFIYLFILYSSIHAEFSIVVCLKMHSFYLIFKGSFWHVLSSSLEISFPSILKLSFHRLLTSLAYVVEAPVGLTAAALKDRLLFRSLCCA